MKRLFLTFGIIACFINNAKAALITRTYSYTSGNTITANENNTNENTLYTEFNGNVESANIKDGTIVNADIADTTIDIAKFSSTVQSTFTYFNAFGSYRRPVLQWISVTTIDIEANTGTLNQTCIVFPDSQRCVTENTTSTDKYRRFIITSTATFLSGTEDSGMSGAWAASEWMALYAVKSQVSASNFVIAGTTNTPTQANYATLNTMFGTNGWVYLGMVKIGDQGAGTTTSILSFVQTGGMTVFTNNATGVVINSNGVRLNSTAGATSLTYSYSSGISGTAIPSHLTMAQYAASIAGGGTGSDLVKDSGNNYIYGYNEGSSRFHVKVWVPSSQGIYAENGSSIGMQLWLCGYIDGVLASGTNPQL